MFVNEYPRNGEKIVLASYIELYSKVCNTMNRVAIIEISNGLGSFFTRYLDKSEYTIFPVWKTSQLPDKEFTAYIFTGDFNNISDGLLPIHEKETEFVESIKGKKIFA